MSTRTAPVGAPSDDDLLTGARAGDASAFDELWARHVRSAQRVARQFAQGVDADALVTEVRDSLRTRILAGGGPAGAFRPYLYTAVREAARVEAEPDAATGASADDPEGLERTVTVRAYRSLPERWQTVLWYTEVEGLRAAEVAPLIGMSAAAVEILAERARTGLRSAWLRQHAVEASGSADCRWTIARLDGDRADLTSRERRRLEEHLDVCGRCTALADRVASGGPRLAAAVVPVVVGSVAGGALLSQLAVAGAAHAATGAVGAAAAGASTAGAAAAATGAATAGVATGAGVAAGAAGAGVAAGTGAAATVAGMPALVSGIAAVALVGGSVVLGPSAATAPAHVAAPVAASSASTAVVPTASVSTTSTATPLAGPTGATGASAAGASAPGAPAAASPHGPDAGDLQVVSGLLSGMRIPVPVGHGHRGLLIFGPGGHVVPGAPAAAAPTGHGTRTPSGRNSGTPGATAPAAPAPTPAAPAAPAPATPAAPAAPAPPAPASAPPATPPRTTGPARGPGSDHGVGHDRGRGPDHGTDRGTGRGPRSHPGRP